ncbi:putative tyrosine-protein phosphatase OCA6 [Pseudozyma hubeiensis]|nr:putative tyrosine-protein phosphatase OCA6 [Pseudozyma hubeiensis]
MSLKPLTPPLRFSTVAFACTDQPQPSWQAELAADDADPRSHPHHRESVYRGAYPKARNLSFLNRLHLRTVLSLTPRPLDSDVGLLEWSTSAKGPLAPSPSPTPSVTEKVSRLGVQLLHVRCEKPKDESGGLTREGAARALSVLLDRRNHPIYVHCLDGVEVTSTLVACMRKVQAWSNPAILAELGRALRDSNSSEWTEVPSHLSSFLSKFGQPDGIRLPPRNHIPSWLWPPPNPLSILADPYAWAGSSHPHHLANGHVQQVAAPSASASTTDASLSRSPSHTSALNGPSDTNGGATSRTSPNPPMHSHMRRDRQLPIHHPTLKLHFDVDPDLPPEPVVPLTAASAASATIGSVQRPMTPSRPLHMHSRTSSYNSNASLRTPPHSRPASRSGRAPASSSHATTSRSASLAPDDDRAGASSLSRRTASTARGPDPSVISPSLASGALHAAVSAIPSVAAFLESQVSDQDTSASGMLAPQSNESPTRRSRSNLVPEPRVDEPRANAPLSQAAQDSSLNQQSSTSSTTPDGDADEIDVSTPRARPITSSNYHIGITGTIFHHDDDITDNEADHSGPSRAQAVGIRSTDAARIVVPLEQRRRPTALDEADGEQTPTKANASAHRQLLQSTGPRLSTDLSISAVKQSQSASLDQHSRATLRHDESLSDSAFSNRSSTEKHTDDRHSEDMVQSPTAYEHDEDASAPTSRRNTGSYNSEDGQTYGEEAITSADLDESDKIALNVEEEEEDGDEEGEEEAEEEEDEEDEDEEEEEEEEEEEDEDDDDEDDLALEALDLEGY